MSLIFISSRIYHFNGKANLLLIQSKCVSLPKPPFLMGYGAGGYTFAATHTVPSVPFNHYLISLPLFGILLSVHLDSHPQQG